MLLSSLFASLSLLLPTGSQSPTAAAVDAATLVFNVGVEGNLQQFQENLQGVGEGLFAGEGGTEGSSWVLSWEATVNPDPFVNGVFSLTNLSAVTQTFILSVTLPIIPQGPLTKIGGSVGLTLTDSNNNGVASVTDAGDGIYFGQIDGADVLELFNDPYSLSVAFAGQTVVDSDLAGLPGPTILGPAATATIGIYHRFKLTPGDSIGLTSFFVVEAVPEASSMSLVGAAGATLVGFGAFRRRLSK
jgi:hypothetical protein